MLNDCRNIVRTICLKQGRTFRVGATARWAASVEKAQAFYNAIVKRHGVFPLEWELPILRTSVAAFPDRGDLVERLAFVEEALAALKPSTTVETSCGPFALNKAEHSVLAQLLAGAASVEKAQAFYNAIVKRHGVFPLEWELPILRTSVAAFPDRGDLVERLALWKRRSRRSNRQRLSKHRADHLP